MLPLNQFAGKTISSVERIVAEYGRTYNHYLCFVFSDGSKSILYGDEPYNPKPSLKEMRKAPNFYTPEDIADRVLRDEQESRRLAEQSRQQKLYQLEQLKKELGET